MEIPDFKIQLKESHGTTLAFILAYDKAFKNHRFIWSTGIKVKAKRFKPETPGPALKRHIKMAESACESLATDNRPINNDTLKFRIEVIKNGFGWVKDNDGNPTNELHIWDGRAVQYYTLPDSVSREVLEPQLRKELNKQKPDFKRVIEGTLTAGQNGLFGFWSGIIEGTIELRHGKKLRPSSQGVKRQSMNLVKEFDPLASFEKMDMAFYNAFVRWLKDQTVKVKLPDGKSEERPRFDTNTIGKHVRQFKSVLHLAYRNELMQNDRFKYWPVAKESNEVVTLSKDELLKIHAKEIPGTKGDVKDIFVMACFLGPRISDFKALNKTNLSTQAGITYFEYVQEKTGSRVKIPVHPVVHEILNKRGGEFPRMISEQNFRAHLKEICKEAELNDRVIVKIRDGKPQYKKKWQAISPHSARRTFASGLFYGWFNKAMPASFCMRFSGHKTEKSFQLYIGASEADLDAKALEYFDLQPVMKAV